MTAKSASMSRKGITESTLKIIAIVVMLIDHVGFGVIEPMMEKLGYGTGLAGNELSNWISSHVVLSVSYIVCRIIGRTGFLMFCFMLVEGFFHTRSWWKYLTRLFIFGLISEVPFDLMCYGKVFSLDGQNIYFTLCLAVILMQLSDFIVLSDRISSLSNIVRAIIVVIITIPFGIIVEVIHADYGMFGIFAISAMYMVRRFTEKSNSLGFFIACVVFVFRGLAEIFSFAALFVISQYNGERGFKLRWVFYLFYPTHLLIIYFVARLLGV